MNAALAFFLLLISIQMCRFQVVLPLNDNCTTSQCDSESGPNIQFPFRLQDQPKFCGYQGFELHCQENITKLKLPSSKEFPVHKILYNYQTLVVSDTNGCLARIVLDNNLFMQSSFRQCTELEAYMGQFGEYRNRQLAYHNYFVNYKLFNCSSKLQDDYDYQSVPCLSDLSGHFYFFRSGEEGNIPFSLSCRAVSETIWLSMDHEELCLAWDQPDCRNCSADWCQLNQKTNKVECINISDHTYPPLPPEPYTIAAGGQIFRRLAIGLSIAASAVITSAVLLLAHKRSIKEKKGQDIKIEQFLEEYKAKKPARYSYSEIKKMTENFKNSLGDGGYGKVFKGKLGNAVPVAVKVLENPTGNGDDFINEVGTIGRIHHVNVVQLLGFCVEGSNRALIYEFMPNESLEKFIYLQDDQSKFFSWCKLHEIALGIARGIEYLHLGCEQRIVHFDIKPHNILLDDKFTPKVSDFGLAKLCSKEKSIVTMTAARGTMGYIAPEVFLKNFNLVSHKSDVYSFGMLLLEMVGGKRKNNVENKDSQVYFPEWLYKRLEQGEELELTTEKDEDDLTARKLAIVGLSCAQWDPIDRPSMKLAVKMLEGSLESMTLPPNPFSPPDEVQNVGTMANISPAANIEVKAD
ncbi:putative receptor-like protein kinase [Apostasia shenzhenica]|uniref:Putative receptor-like protein kinase n=1 Tax=Apostasia shenzhenica TaxID=1088818 RepID=A0A2I0A146_9ASPA|nr:putative receptor-like protein kinase [Apostasia shenzhenica]